MQSWEFLGEPLASNYTTCTLDFFFSVVRSKDIAFSDKGDKKAIMYANYAH